MSNAKLTAAREFIQEKQYAAARQILETMDDPTAQKWLAQLDTIAPRTIPPPSPHYNAPQHYNAPPPVSAEAEHYYRAQNRKHNRRRIGKGIELIFMGIGCLAAAAYMASLPKFTIPGSPPPDNSLSLILFAGGVICLLAGYFRLRRRD